MTEISSEEAECSNGVATTPCDRGDMLKVAKVRSVFVALTSNVVHEGTKIVPSPLSLCNYCSQKSVVLLTLLKLYPPLEEPGGGRGGFGSSLKCVYHFFQPTSPTVHP